MLNSSHKKMAILSIYKPGFSARWSQRVSSITEVMLDGWPAGTDGDRGLPKSRKFLRMLVTDRLLHLATLAICEMVSFFLLRVIWTMDWRCQFLRLRAILKRAGALLVLEWRQSFWGKYRGGCEYSWGCNNTYTTSSILYSIIWHYMYHSTLERQPQIQL